MDSKIRIRLTHVDAPAATHLEAVMDASDGVGMEYQEMSISVFDHDQTEVQKPGNPLMVADILIGLNETGELRVLISTDCQPVEHTVAIYPLREKSKAMEGWEG